MSIAPRVASEHAQTHPLPRSAEREGHPLEVLEQGSIVSAVKKLEFGFAFGVALTLVVFAFGSAAPTQFSSLRAAMGVKAMHSERSVDGVVKVAYAAKMDDYLSVGP